MMGTRKWPSATALLAAIVPLGGCDETSTTAPAEPPERVPVEEVPEAVVLGETDLVLLDEAFRYNIERLQRRIQELYLAAYPSSDFPAHPETEDDFPTRQTHELTNWSNFAICADCELQLTEVVRFGEADGHGVIDGIAPRVSWNEKPGYVVVGSTFLQLFDDDGRFVRRIGREGDGPGEFGRVIDAHVVDGRLVALDQARRAWSIFNLAGEFIEARPYGYRAGPFTPVGGSHVVVVAMDPSPEAAGLPFHLAHIDSGVPSRHFGSGQGRDRNRENGPYSDNLTGSVASRPGTVWWGSAGSPRVEEWSVDDELLRVVDGELPWFPEVTESIDPTTDPPSTLLMSIALDGREYLWMTVRTADPGWREVELERTPEGYRVPPERRGDYMDTRLDIFDLEERRHLGRYVWDSPYARLIDLGGEPAVSIVEYDEEMVPQVVVYRVGGSRTRQPIVGLRCHQINVECGTTNGTAWLFSEKAS